MPNASPDHLPAHPEPAVTLPDAFRRLRRSLLFVPICTLLVIGVLAALRISGSSVGILSEDGASAQSALDVRPVRSDEWHMRTPMVVRQAALDFPRTTDVGMGVHDIGALLDFPVKSPAAIVKPNSWPYFVLGVEHAFAAEWWLTVLGPFLGIYAVVAVLTRSPSIAALSGLLGSAAPVAAWWTVPWLGLTVLYAGLMAALVIRGFQVQSRRRYVLFALGGWAAACCVAQLYLPWVVPICVLFGAVALSQFGGAFGSWRHFVAAAAIFATVFAVLLAVFYREHHVALEAIANSVYPGRRTTTSGGAWHVLIFGAPYDVFTLPSGSETVSFTNQSEASSGLMLWLPIALVGGGFGGIRSKTGGARALAIVLVAALIFFAWAVLPVPTAIGGLLGLTKVQGSRMVVPLTMAGALAAGLYVHRVRTDASFRPSRNRVMIGTITFVFLIGRAATQMSINGVPLPRAPVLLLLILFGLATFFTLEGRTVLGLGGACLLLLFSTARVNPLQVGLKPLTDSPLLHQVAAIDSIDPGARWLSAGGDIFGFALLTASGVRTTTGVDMYAVPDTWHLLDPTDAAEHVWNRFANIDVSIDNTVPAPQILAPQADLILIITPSCNGALQALDVKYVTEPQQVSLPCLRERVRPSATGERWIYEVVSQ